jgi:hypothetical protein
MSERAQFILICLFLLLLANLLTAIQIHPKEGFVASVTNANLPIAVTLPPTSYSQDISVANSAIQAANQAAVLASRAEEMEIILASYAAQKSLQAGTSAAVARGLSTQNAPISTTGGITSVGLSTNLSSAIQAQSAALSALGLVGMGSGTSTANYTVGQSATMPAGVTFTAATSAYTLPNTPF